MPNHPRATRLFKSTAFWFCLAGALPWLIFVLGLYWASQQQGFEGLGIIYFMLAAGLIGIVNAIWGGILLARGRVKGGAVALLWTALIFGGLIPIGCLSVLLGQAY